MFFCSCVRDASRAAPFFTTASMRLTLAASVGPTDGKGAAAGVRAAGSVGTPRVAVVVVAEVFRNRCARSCRGQMVPGISFSVPSRGLPTPWRA
jgi:hypothetical protein